MRARVITASLVATGAAASLAIAAPAAFAAPAVARTIPHVSAAAAGSTINSSDSAIRSAPTANSRVNTLQPDITSANSLASSGSAGLLAAGALVTRASSSAVPNGLMSMSHARTTGVTLLNGLVTASAVDSKATATVTTDGHATTTINSTIGGLKVAGLPVAAPAPNQTITVPGVVSISLNAGTSSTSRVGARTSGAALVVTLLSGTNAGAVITVNPVSASADLVGKGYAPLSGYAYATRATGNIGNVLRLTLNRTGLITIPGGGTKGRDLTNDTAGVTVPGLGNIGAVTSTANGVVGQSATRGTLTTHVASVNLFGGLITADGINAQAEMTQDADGNRVASGSSQLVNLKIGGKSIPADVAPNTGMTLAGVGAVLINQQLFSANRSIVRAITIRISSASSGLPAGTIIEVGTAVSSFRV